MNIKDEDMIAAEADARLDEFFAEDEWQAEAGEDGADPAEELGIKELKALILSLDWEITDEIMAKLKSEVDVLRTKWKGDSVLTTFLSLLDNLGKYISKKKAEAHPDSVGLLQNAYKNLEKVLCMTGMDEDSRKQIVLEDVHRFKKLREEIAAAKASKAPAASGSGLEMPESAISMAAAPKKGKTLVTVEAEGHEAPGGEAIPGTMIAAQDGQAMANVLEKIVSAIHELKETIKTESAALRSEMETLKGQ